MKQNSSLLEKAILINNLMARSGGGISSQFSSLVTDTKGLIAETEVATTALNFFLVCCFFLMLLFFDLHFLLIVVFIFCGSGLANDCFFVLFCSLFFFFSQTQIFISVIIMIICTLVGVVSFAANVQENAMEHGMNLFTGTLFISFFFDVVFF